MADVGETNIGLQDCQVELYFDYMGSNSQCWSQVSVLDPGSLISKFIHFDQLMKVLRFKLTLWSCVILRPVEYVTQCKSVNSEDCYTSYINLRTRLSIDTLPASIYASIKRRSGTRLETIRPYSSSNPSEGVTERATATDRGRARRQGGRALPLSLSRCCIPKKIRLPRMRGEREGEDGRGRTDGGGRPFK